MELRKGPVPSASDTILNFLEIASVPEGTTWRLGEDGGLSPGYESVLTAGYELVDLDNPACEKLLRQILEVLVTTPSVEVSVIPEPEDASLAV